MGVIQNYVDIQDLKKNSSGGGGLVPYSLDETEIGTWIDGSPLYQKVVDISDVGYIGGTSSGGSTLPNKIKELGKIITTDVIVDYSDYGYFNSYPIFQKDNSNWSAPGSSSVSIQSGRKAYAIVKYIK